VIEQAKCGWLCPAGSPERLAEAMREAMQTRDLAAIGDRGRALAGASFSTERMARDYEQLYRALLA
jgi:glycosyltransferase involved in cell wall biosynthesis